MNFRAKKEAFENIKSTFKAEKFIRELGYSKSYISLVFNGRKIIPKHSAFAFTKCIDLSANIEDYFEEV